MRYIRSGNVDAQQLHAAVDDAGDLPGQLEAHRAHLGVLLLEDRMVVVIAIELLGQLVDIGPDDRRREVLARGGSRPTDTPSATSPGRSLRADSRQRQPLLKSMPASAALRSTERMRALVYWMKGPVLPLKSIDSRGSNSIVFLGSTFNIKYLSAPSPTIVKTAFASPLPCIRPACPARRHLAGRRNHVRDQVVGIDHRAPRATSSCREAPTMP